MVVETQRLYATFESERDVMIMASDWTPDYVGLTSVVERELDLEALNATTDPRYRKSLFIGEGRFDKNAERLRPENVELFLNDRIKQEYPPR